MIRTIRCRVLLLPVLAALAFSSPVQSFSFCFSFGNNNQKFSPYSRYPSPYPPPPTAFYPADPEQLLQPGAVYSPMYPPPPVQPYGVLMPRQPGW